MLALRFIAIFLITGGISTVVLTMYFGKYISDIIILRRIILASISVGLLFMFHYYLYIKFGAIEALTISIPGIVVSCWFFLKRRNK